MKIVTTTETAEMYYHRRAGDLVRQVYEDIDSGIVGREDVVSFLSGPEIVPFCRSLRDLDVKEGNEAIENLTPAQQDAMKIVLSRALLRKFRQT